MCRRTNQCEYSQVGTPLDTARSVSRWTQSLPWSARSLRLVVFNFSTIQQYFAADPQDTKTALFEEASNGLRCDTPNACCFGLRHPFIRNQSLL